MQQVNELGRSRSSARPPASPATASHAQHDPVLVSSLLSDVFGPLESLSTTRSTRAPSAKSDRPTTGSSSSTVRPSRHSFTRDATLERKSSTTRRTSVDSLVLEGGVRKNRSSTSGSNAQVGKSASRWTRSDGNGPHLSAPKNDKRLSFIASHLSTLEGDTPESSSALSSSHAKRRPLLSRIGTVFNSRSTREPTAPAAPRSADLAGFGMTDSHDLLSPTRHYSPPSPSQSQSLSAPPTQTSFVPFSLEPAQISPKSPEEVAPVLPSKQKPPPLVLHSSNLVPILSNPDIDAPSLSLIPPRARSRSRSPQPSPSPASSHFVSSVQSPNGLLSPSSASLSPATTRGPSSPRFPRSRNASRSRGPPLTPPPSYPIPDIPGAAPSEAANDVASPASRQRLPSSSFLSPPGAENVGSTLSESVEPAEEIASFLNLQESDPEELIILDGKADRIDSPVLGDRRSGDVDRRVRSPTKTMTITGSRRVTPRIEVNSPRSPPIPTDTDEAEEARGRRKSRPSLTLDLNHGPARKPAPVSVVQHSKQDSDGVAGSIVTTTSDEYVTPATDAKDLEKEKAFDESSTENVPNGLDHLAKLQKRRAKDDDRDIERSETVATGPRIASRTVATFPAFSTATTDRRPSECGRPVRAVSQPATMSSSSPSTTILLDASSTLTAARLTGSVSLSTAPVVPGLESAVSPDQHEHTEAGGPRPPNLVTLTHIDRLVSNGEDNGNKAPEKGRGTAGAAAVLVHPGGGGSSHHLHHHPNNNHASRHGHSSPLLSSPTTTTPSAATNSDAQFASVSRDASSTTLLPHSPTSPSPLFGAKSKSSPSKTVISSPTTPTLPHDDAKQVAPPSPTTRTSTSTSPSTRAHSTSHHSHSHSMSMSSSAHSASAAIIDVAHRKRLGDAGGQSSPDGRSPPVTTSSSSSFNGSKFHQQLSPASSRHIAAPPISIQARITRVSGKSPVFYVFEAHGLGYSSFLDSDSDTSDDEDDEEEMAELKAEYKARFGAAWEKEGAKRMGMLKGPARRLAYTKPRRRATQLQQSHSMGKPVATAGRSPTAQQAPASIPAYVPLYGRARGQSVQSKQSAPATSPVRANRISTASNKSQSSSKTNTTPARDESSNRRISSASAGSGPPIAVSRSNLDGIVLPKPAVRRPAANSVASVGTVPESPTASNRVSTSEARKSFASDGAGRRVSEEPDVPGRGEPMSPSSSGSGALEGRLKGLFGRKPKAGVDSTSAVPSVLNVPQGLASAFTSPQIPSSSTQSPRSNILNSNASQLSSKQSQASLPSPTTASYQSSSMRASSEFPASITSPTVPPKPTPALPPTTPVSSDTSRGRDTTQAPTTPGGSVSRMGVATGFLAKIRKRTKSQTRPDASSSDAKSPAAPVPEVPALPPPVPTKRISTAPALPPLPSSAPLLDMGVYGSRNSTESGGRKSTGEYQFNR